MACISSKKWNSLRNQMLNLDISESDIQESFVLSSGSGDQKVNKTYSCVQLNYKGHKVRC
jgi:Protein chain release factor B